MKTLREVRDESVEIASVTGQEKDWRTPTITTWEVAEETLVGTASGPDADGTGTLD